MCGIAGYLSFGPTPDGEADALERTSAAMQARGPDGSGTWIAPDGAVGLAHRRLAIIDLSPAAAQPMQDDSGDVVITFNGEIYNYRQLRDALIADGASFASSSDTEVILELYRRYGARVTEHLRGMYALAIWDSRSRRLFLARDPFGMKPLYWSKQGGVFRFASQVKALLAGGRIARDPSPEGTTGFLLWGSVPEPFTLFANIRSVEAGSALTVDADGSIAEGRLAAVRDDRGTEASASGLAVALRDSVRHHLVADVPVGLFLSAGVDSAVIAAHAASMSTAPLRSITVGFEEFRGTAYDETEAATRLARRFGLDHRTVWIGRDDFDACFDHILQSMDQPTIDGINSYFVARAAAGAGLKVALSGIGGDELFGGYPSFRQVPLTAALLGWMRRIPRLAAMAGRAARSLRPLLASPKYAGLFDHATSLGGAYFVRRALFLPRELEGVLTPDFVATGLAGLATTERLEAIVAGSKTPFEAVSRLEVAQYMRNQLLRDADWAGMAHSLEIRLPLVDIELERTVTRRQRAGRPFRKLDLAATVEPPLPDAIARRRKTGFRTPTWRRDPGSGAAMPGVADWRSWALELLARAGS